MGVINIGMLVICMWLYLPVVLGVNCTFETGFCNWTQDTTNALQWKLYGTNTSNNVIIPSGDHTTGSGFVMFVDSSKKGNAQVKSKTIKSGQYCLSLWYLMVGNDVNAFNVKRTIGDTIKNMFSTFGSQGRVWKEAKVGLSFSRNFQIVIEAKFKDGGRSGYIGVDDVSISSGPCPLDCTFNYGFCAWNPTSKNVKFTRKLYKDISLNLTYLASDKDYYLTVIKNEDSDTGVATMVSTWQRSVSKCLTFQVYLFGTTDNVLNVYIQRRNVKDLFKIYSINNTYDKTMHQEFVDINSTITSEYRIAFKTEVTSDKDGNILIDNITSIDTSCPYGCESSPCKNGATCKDGIHGNYTCMCTENWSGRTCNISLTTTPEVATTETSSTPGTVSGCESSPCKNGATCKDGIHGNYTCMCKENWSGRTCNISLTTTPEVATTETSSAPPIYSAARKQVPIVYIITPVAVVLAITVVGIVAFILRRKRRQRKDDKYDTTLVSDECIGTGVDNHEYALTEVSRDKPTENIDDQLNDATEADYETCGEDDISTNRLGDNDNWIHKDTAHVATLATHPSSTLYENTAHANVLTGITPEMVGESEETNEESSYDTLSATVGKNVGTSGDKTGEMNEYDTFAKCRSAESEKNQDEQEPDNPYDHISNHSELNDNTLRDDDDYSHTTSYY